MDNIESAMQIAKEAIEASDDDIVTVPVEVLKCLVQTVDDVKDIMQPYINTIYKN